MCDNESDNIEEVVSKLEEISSADDAELAGAIREIRNCRTVIIPENPFPEISVDSYPPMKFSWFIPKRIAAMGLPRNKENLQFLVNEGITHLITLSEEKQPPKDECEELRYTTIPVPEYQLPSIEQIGRFIDLCKNANKNETILGVHCRSGRGRCGVVLACYLIYFYKLTDKQAINAINEMRKGSLETEEHEELVTRYFEDLKKDNPLKFGASDETIQELLRVEEVKIQSIYA